MARHLRSSMLTLLFAWGCGESPAPSHGDASIGAAPPPFADVGAEIGIDFDVDRSTAGDYFMPDSIGTGCALLDYDGDGDLDVYVVNAFRAGPGRLTGRAGANVLYRQEAGGRFVDVSRASGLDHEGYGQGVAAGDYDNDGDVDLYLTNYGPDALFRNDGDGTFTDVTDAASIDTPAWSTSAGFFDFDNDGWLDVFVTTYLDYDEAAAAADASGRREYPAPGLFGGVADVLYRNDGDGTFTDVSVAVGIAGVPGKGLGVVFTDLSGDGRPDVYVANDGEPNFAWVRGEDGRFEDQAMLRGLAVNAYGRPEASMGVACGDADGDGDLDLFLTHIVQESNTFYRRGDAALYADETMAAGLGAASVDFTGFGTAFLDIDLDGDLDLVSVNGRVLRWNPHPATLVNDHWRPYAEPNQVFRNDGRGRFREAPDAGGGFCADVEVSRGLAVGDLDGDGDLDLLVSSANGTLRVYRNESPHLGGWLLVRAVDPALSRDAIGARIEVRAGGRTIRRDVRTAHSFLSASDPRAHFGLGPVRRFDGITVTWPGGEREAFPGGEADREVDLSRGSGTPLP